MKRRATWAVRLVLTAAIGVGVLNAHVSEWASARASLAGATGDPVTVRAASAPGDDYCVAESPAPGVAPQPIAGRNASRGRRVSGGGPRALPSGSATAAQGNGNANLKVTIYLHRDVDVLGERPGVPTSASLYLPARWTIEKLVNGQWVLADGEWRVCAVVMNAHVRVTPRKFYRPSGVGIVPLVYLPLFSTASRRLFHADRLQDQLRREGGWPLFRVAVLGGDTATITIQNPVMVTLQHRATGRMRPPIPANLDPSAARPVTVTVKER